MKYLLDSNTFIDAKNRYYGMNFCPAYWDWIVGQNRSLEVASISFVADELKKGNDELASWVKLNPDIFVDVGDEATQIAFGQIVEFLMPQAHKMKVGALDDFLIGADPWLIAKAMASDATVVTQEVFNLQIKKKFLIPNVCAHFNISCMNTFDLLNKLKAQFVLAA
jgi:hypothetical protein